MVVFPAFFPNKSRKLCFVINVLNNKTIILLSVAEYRLILANSAILSYLILSYLILSHLILSYLILSYLILSYPSIRSDEGLTLETSAFRISVRWPIYIYQLR